MVFFIQMCNPFFFIWQINYSDKLFIRLFIMHAGRQGNLTEHWLPNAESMYLSSRGQNVPRLFASASFQVVLGRKSNVTSPVALNGKIRLGWLANNGKFKMAGLEPPLSREASNKFLIAGCSADHHLRWFWTVNAVHYLLHVFLHLTSGATNVAWNSVGTIPVWNRTHNNYCH